MQVDIQARGFALTADLRQHAQRRLLLALSWSGDDVGAVSMHLSPSQGPRGGNLRIRAAMVDPAWVDIAVANDGPPIPKDVLPHIFEPFFSTKQAASGVGLGLAVTYGIVKRHGGDIQVTTGERTTFHVILPVGATPPESQNTEEADVGRDTVHTDR